MRRSRYFYTCVDWVKEILGYIFWLVIWFVLGFIMKLFWVFFVVGWDLK